MQKKNGAEYIVSPWALTWDDENYYMVGYEEASRKIKHYRVDKMQEIRVTEAADFAPALARAIRSGKPAVIDCRIDPDDKVFPMIPPGRSIKDVILKD